MSDFEISSTLNEISLTICRGIMSERYSNKYASEIIMLFNEIDRLIFIQPEVSNTTKCEIHLNPAYLSNKDKVYYNIYSMLSGAVVINDYIHACNLYKQSVETLVNLNVDWSKDISFALMQKYFEENPTTPDLTIVEEELVVIDHLQRIGDVFKSTEFFFATAIAAFQ